MKKITSPSTIDFAISGTHKVVIDSEGVLVTDAESRVIAERLGSQVTINDMEPDAIEVPVVEVEQTPAPEPAPTEVVAPSEESAA